MARFCTECGASLADGVRFCVECGTPVAVQAAPAAPAAAAPPATVAPPAPAAVPPPPAPAPVVPAPVAVRSAPAPRARRGLPGCVTVLLALLLLFFGATAAAAAYIIAPDLPPGGPLAALPDSLGAIKDQLPVFGVTGEALPPLPQEEQLRAATAQLAAAANPVRQQERALQQQLQATGLPITVVTRTSTPAGAPALVVGMDYDRIAGGLSLDFALSPSVEAFLRLVRSNQLNVTQVDHVIVAIHDSQGRVLFGAAAPAPAIAQLRDGKITQKDFLRKAAVQAQSRAGIVDRVRQMVAGLGR